MVKNYKQAFRDMVSLFVTEKLDNNKSEATIVGIESKEEQDIVLDIIKNRYKYVIISDSILSVDKAIWICKSEFIYQVVKDLYKTDMSDSLRSFAFCSLLGNKDYKMNLNF